MPYGRSSLHENEDELPESDDELIMNVLNDLGIQERPDIERRTSDCINPVASEPSRYTVVGETLSKRCSVAFSEASDSCTLAFRNSSDDQLKQAAIGKRQLEDQITFLMQEARQLRASVLTEREQEREQIRDLKQKLQESQTKLERWQNSCRKMHLENQHLRAVGSALERQKRWIESRMDSILDENFDTIGHFNTPSRVDFCTSSSSISMISEEPPSPSSSTSIAPSPFIPRARR